MGTLWAAFVFRFGVRIFAGFDFLPRLIRWVCWVGIRFGCFRVAVVLRIWRFANLVAFGVGLFCCLVIFGYVMLACFASLMRWGLV